MQDASCTMAQMYFENIWKWILKWFHLNSGRRQTLRGLQCCAPVTSNAERRSTGHSTTDWQNWQNWEVFLPHFFLGTNILACHFYINEMHQQGEDNLKTLTLFGNISFMFGEIPNRLSGECCGGSLGATWEVISVNETWSPLPEEQTSTEVHQEASPKRTSRWAAVMHKPAMAAFLQTHRRKGDINPT